MIVGVLAERAVGEARFERVEMLSERSVEFLDRPLEEVDAWRGVEVNFLSSRSYNDEDAHNAQLKHKQ